MNTKTSAGGSTSRPAINAPNPMYYPEEISFQDYLLFNGFYPRIKIGDRLKTRDFKIFSIHKFGLTALIGKLAMKFRKSIINDNRVTGGDPHLVYSVKNLKISILK